MTQLLPLSISSRIIDLYVVTVLFFSESTETETQQLMSWSVCLLLFASCNILSWRLAGNTRPWQMYKTNCFHKYQTEKSSAVPFR